ncbi:aminoacyltransferase [candidate division WWE3 bacterium]|uniref:Aminoacyltransferase n=1 Tax=candidate division WWE3 bacterium TaxID=2053526 RepID=A0A7X9HSL0_UNCKA|nr:aminoacyltransferase [candidate division WWE3 bacterium]
MIPVSDIRQSDKWALYLKGLGWSSHRTTRGICVEYIKTILGTMVKIQHPIPLTLEDLKEIEDFCVKQKALFIKIEPFVGQDVSILERSGYKKNFYPLSPPSTIYIDLTKSEEDLWDNLSHSARYSIRRAQREGTVTRFYQNPLPEKVPDYFEMLKSTARRKHFYVQPLKDFLAKIKIFGKDCHLVLSYDSNGKLLSGKFYLCHGDMVLYSTGGTSKEGLKTKAGYELLWRSILYFKGLGYKVFDLEGKDDSRFESITKNWGGFSHFKEKFNGEEIEFPYPYVKYLNPLLKFASKFGNLPF